MTISYLYVGVLDCDKVNGKKVVSRGWCKESTPFDYLNKTLIMMWPLCAR